jgi:hypothetical protein
MKENVIEELSAYQDASVGDGKRMATQKEDIKVIIGRSPDDSDCFIMRMYFEIRKKMLPDTGSISAVVDRQISMMRNKSKEIRSNK